MKAPCDLSCHWKQELGNKVLIWDWALYQIIVLLKPACVFFESARHVTQLTFCSMYYPLWSLWCRVVCKYGMFVSMLMLFFFSLPKGYLEVSGMLEPWKQEQEWLKEHGETPTPPGLWAPAVFVMYYWDLRLPMETLSTFPWWHHQGERGRKPLLCFNDTSLNVLHFWHRVIFDWPSMSYVWIFHLLCI